MKYPRPAYALQPPSRGANTVLATYPSEYRSVGVRGYAGDFGLEVNVCLKIIIAAINKLNYN